MSLQVYIDGKYYNAEDAKISVWDHGFLYGDGVFEGIRTYEGRIFRLDQHMDRFYDSAKSVKLDVHLTKEKMKEAVIETCRLNELMNAYIRLVVSRGKGDLGLDPRKCSKPTLVIIADKIKLYPEEMYKRGLKLIIASTRKNIPEALNSKIKSLNYLNNILAKIEATQAGADEAVMINVDGFVAECTSENIFIVKNGVIYTPPGYVGILEGITRGAVIDLARSMGIKVEIDMLNSHDLFVADECFLTGTGAEMIAAVEINGRVIGNGKPGQLTTKLLAAFRELTKVDGTPIYQGLAKENFRHPKIVKTN